jgi:hypothetical protein
LAASTIATVAARPQDSAWLASTQIGAEVPCNLLPGNDDTRFFEPVTRRRPLSLPVRKESTPLRPPVTDILVRLDALGAQL